MKRGDIIIAILPGAYGKARPAIVVQADRLAQLDSLLVCPTTSDLVEQAHPIRPIILPTPENGLRVPSQIMVEKLTAVGRRRCGDIIGRLDDAALQELDERLALVLGLAD